MSELTTDTNEIITGYKAFNPEFKCRGFQYKVGKTFEHEGESGLCSKGFHFCPKDPLDVFNYYPLVSMESGLPTRLAKVSAPKRDTIIDRDGTKCVTSAISIDREITLNELIKEQIKKAYASEGKVGLLIATEVWSTLTDSGLGTKIISNKDETHVSLTRSHSMAIVSANYAYLASSGHSTGLFATGKYARLSSSGGYTDIYSNGHYSSTSSSGRFSRLRIIGNETSIASSGALAAINVKGNYTNTSSSGEASKLRITGHHAGVASSGAYSKLTVTGNEARIAAVGEFSRVIYEGKDGVITVLGPDTEFKGSEGTLVLAVTYDDYATIDGGLVGRIGEDGLKPDTLYTVRDGKFVEAETENE